jgi:hypothetical protein
MDVPAGGETGVTCGLRAGLPLIVNGISRHSPFNELAKTVVGQDGDLVDAVETVAAEYDFLKLPTAPAPRSDS